MSEIKVAMIAAVAENGVIGSKQSIPWRIPSDFAYFRRTTMGKPLVMGRKQFETVGKPLPGRTNIVVTRQENYAPEGVVVVPDLEEAMARARTVAEADGVGEVMIIGGGEIYRQTMALADRLYISHVALRPEGEVFFPPIDPGRWVASDEPEVPRREKDEAEYRVVIYERRS